MAKWVENFKRIYNTIHDDNDKAYMLLALEDRCDERGYSPEETKKVVEYVKGAM